MHRSHLFARLVLLFMIAMAACGPREAPAADAPKADDVPPEEGAPTPTLEPINLGGPEMLVGSKWLYVDGSTLVAVPAGAFTMGREGGVDNPAHEVSISEFWLYETEVTNSQYALCVARGACTAPDPGDNPGFEDFRKAGDPVTGVNWQQAGEYCKFAHGRLPTEAEWEKAARGPESNIYPWGEEAPSCALLNFDNCIGNPTNVTLYPQGQSHYLALDMSGNTYEWTSDRYLPDYYIGSPSDNPLGPETGIQRVVRSSAFDSGGSQTPLFSRFFSRPEDHRANLGFRCVVEDPTYFAPACELVGLYGSAPGGSGNPGEDIEAVCSNLDIDVQPLECGSNATNVTFKSDDASAVYGGVAACTPGGGSFPGNVLVTCTSATIATLDGTCTFNGLGQATCPAHYTLDEGTGQCKWDGSGGSSEQCLPGDTYDPVNQCCVAAPGGASDVGLCEAGSVVVQIGPGAFGCVNSQSAPPPPHLQAVVDMPGACEGGSDDEPAACQKSCGPCQILDLIKCECKSAPICEF